LPWLCPEQRVLPLLTGQQLAEIDCDFVVL